MNKLPDEIINIIIDYRLSYLFHEKFKICLNEIPLSSALMKIEYIDKIYNTTYNQDYLDMILELTTNDDRINMINVLNSCNCCNEHKKNKPTLEQYLNGYVPNYNCKYQKLKKCKCKCRSFCRNLCRAQNDEITII